VCIGIVYLGADAVLGYGTTSPPAADPFDRLKSLAFRRGWIPAAIPIVVFVTAAIVESLLRPGSVNQWFSNALNIGTAIAIFVPAALALLYSPLRSARRLSPLKSRMKEVALPVKGPTLTLDNGLVVTLLGGRVMLVSLLFGLDGSVLRVPVEEALRWTRIRRTRRVATVIPGSATPPLGSELEALRARLGVRLLIAMVREPRQDLLLPSNPRWIATLTASNSFSTPNIERLATELDGAKQFLRSLVLPYVEVAARTTTNSGQGETTPLDIEMRRVALPGERRVGVGFWSRFRGTAPSFQRLVALTLVLTAITVLSGLYSQVLGGLPVLIVLILGGGLIGASARTRRDGFAGGLIFGWAGTFLGFLILLPLEAGLQGGGPLMIGAGLVVGFAGGLVVGFIEGLFGGLAGYVVARFTKKPIRANLPYT